MSKQGRRVKRQEERVVGGGLVVKKGGLSPDFLFHLLHLVTLLHLVPLPALPLTLHSHPLVLDLLFQPELQLLPIPLRHHLHLPPLLPPLLPSVLPPDPPLPPQGFVSDYLLQDKGSNEDKDKE